MKKEFAEVEVHRLALDSVRFRHFISYALGQYEAWATVMDTLGRLRAEDEEEESDAKPDDPD